MRDLRTQFFTRDGVVRAVDGISFDLNRGETLCIVGESGCGKSVTALSILGLIPKRAGRIVGGSIRFEGTELTTQSEAEMRKIRGNRISMIFQEPMTSLNPVLTVGAQIAESLHIHQGLDRRAAWDRAIEMLSLVRIADPKRRAGEYPHQLSGGMRQRVMIAIALACNPQVLIADEPTTALDVTIQAQILNLMLELKDRLGTAIILITHDLGVVAETAQRVIVMYAGRTVEEAPVEELLRNPKHPYTRGLIGSIPRRRTAGQRGRPADPPAGDHGARAIVARGDPWLRLRATLQLRRRPLHAGAPSARCARHRPPRRLLGSRARHGRATMSSDAMPADAPPPAHTAEMVLKVTDLKKHFPVHRGLLSRVVAHVQAVDGVSFEIRRGETLCLVGKSGCGKSTVAKTITRLETPTAGTHRTQRRRHHDARQAIRCVSSAARCRWCSRIPIPRSIRACRPAPSSPSR